MINRCTIAGKLLRNIHRAKAYTGKDIINFRIECRRAEDRPKADVIYCTAIGETATFILKNFEAGDTITVGGRLQEKRILNGDGSGYVTYELMVRKVAVGETLEL